MTHWIRLNPQELNQVKTERVDGITIAVGMSPYDLPDRVRGFYSESLDRFVIEFRYLGPSAENRVPQNPEDADVVLLVGQHSRRLHEIYVNIKAMNVHAVGLQVLVPRVENAIGALGGLIPNRVKNYEVAKTVIAQNRNRLFATLAHTGS
jgi:hypothetical protein